MTSLNGTTEFAESSLESRLAAAEASRDRLEQRAARAEAEVARLRQQLLTFSDKLASAARENDVAVVSTTSSSNAQPAELLNDVVVVPAPEMPLTAVDANVAAALSSPVAIAPAPPVAEHPPPVPTSALTCTPAAPGSEENDGQNSPDGRPQKRSRRVWVFNPKWRNGRDWLEYDESTDQMGCSVCRLAGESGKWARAGITRLRLEAITSHSNDAKHQRHLADQQAAAAAAKKQDEDDATAAQEGGEVGVPPEAAPDDALQEAAALS